MGGIEQVIMFTVYDCGGDLQHCRFTAVDPEVTKRLWSQVLVRVEPYPQVPLGCNGKAVRDDRRNTDIPSRKIAAGHMNQVFEHSQRHTLCHVDYRSSR